VGQNGHHLGFALEVSRAYAPPTIPLSAIVPSRWTLGPPTTTPSAPTRRPLPVSLLCLEPLHCSGLAGSFRRGRGGLALLRPYNRTAPLGDTWPIVRADGYEGLMESKYRERFHDLKGDEVARHTLNTASVADRAHRYVLTLVGNGYRHLPVPDRPSLRPTAAGQLLGAAAALDVCRPRRCFPRFLRLPRRRPGTAAARLGPLRDRTLPNAAPQWRNLTSEPGPANQSLALSKILPII
jgi:hypothetical protein